MMLPKYANQIYFFTKQMNQFFCTFSILAERLIQNNMKSIEEYIKSKGGYSKMSELREAGFQTRDIKILLNDGIIEKVKSGLYKVTSATNVGKLNPSFVDVCKAFPKSVICLLSAAEYHELSTVNPSQIYIAIPRAEKPPQIEFPPVNFYYWEKSIYGKGITEITANNVSVKIYDKEKTICDLFRYRDKLGEDVAIEALKNYLQLKNFDLNKLRDYAKATRIKAVITPYIKAIVG